MTVKIEAGKTYATANNGTINVLHKLPDEHPYAPFLFKVNAYNGKGKYRHHDYLSESGESYYEPERNKQWAIIKPSACKLKTFSIRYDSYATTHRRFEVCKPENKGVFAEEWTYSMEGLIALNVCPLFLRNVFLNPDVWYEVTSYFDLTENN